jgi:hypothetical protein
MASSVTRQSAFFDADMGSFDPNEVSQAVTIPYTAVGGPTGMRVVSRVGTSSNPQPCGTYSRGETEDYTINICDMVWNGGTTAWGTASNWSCGVLPTAVNNVTIPASPSGGNQPTVNVTSAVARNVSVQAGATVTISSGNALTVHGDLTNNGTVNVQNNGSLVQTLSSTLNLTVTGTFNVTRNGSGQYDFWSSPVAGIPTSLLGGNVFHYVPINGTMDPSDDNTGNGDPGWASASGTMIAGKGYAAFGAGQRTFTGTVHNGPLSFGIEFYAPESGPPFSGNLVTKVPFNLVGNPYPSGINVGLFLAENGPGVLADGTVYLWDDPGTGPGTYASSDYAQMNNATFTAGALPPSSAAAVAPWPIIGSHQGFMVRAANTTDLTFDNSMRTAGNTSVFFRQLERRLLWLSAVSSGNHYNQTAVGFFEDATDEADWGYDAPKLNWMNALSLYSLMQNEPYGIQVYGEFSPQREVPLGVHCGQTQTVTLRLDSTQHLTGEDIYLEDRLLGIFHDLRQSDYDIALNQGQHHGRFFLRFDTELVTGIDRNRGNGWRPLAYMHDGVLNVGGSSEAESHLMLMDMSGRLVWEQGALMLEPGRQSFDLRTLASGIYTLRIANAHGLFAQKLIR